MTISTDNKPTSADDQILCYCRSKTHADIKNYMQQEGASFDSLIKSTGVGMDCAACRLNLEVLVGEHFLAQNVAPSLGRKSAFMIPANQYNCGYYLQGSGFSTTLRISNPHLPNARSPIPITDYDVDVRLYDKKGRSVADAAIDLSKASDHSISFSDFPGLPDFGWFTVNIQPKANGFVGNSRPQVAIGHGDHCSTYHMQLGKDASKRRTVTVAAADGKTNMYFAMVNMQRATANVKVTLDGILEPFTAAHTSQIPGLGATLYEVDDAFKGLPDKNILIATVESDVPLRRYFFIKHQDGSLSMDHFPNTR